MNSTAAIGQPPSPSSAGASISTALSRLGEPTPRPGDVRAWAALAVFGGAYYFTPTAMSAIQSVIGLLIHPGPMPPHTLTRNTLAVYTLSYLIWSAFVVAIVAFHDGAFAACLPDLGRSRPA